MPLLTTEDLLLYLYNETSPLQNNIIEEAVNNDWELREKLDILKSSLHTLDKMLESPRPESVQAIMNYAMVTAPVEQHQ